MPTTPGTSSGSVYYPYPFSFFQIGVLSNPTTDPRFVACRNALCPRFGPKDKPCPKDPRLLLHYGLSPNAPISKDSYVGIKDPAPVPANQANSPQQAGATMLNNLINCTDIFLQSIEILKRQEARNNMNTNLHIDLGS